MRRVLVIVTATGILPGCLELFAAPDRHPSPIHITSPASGATITSTPVVVGWSLEDTNSAYSIDGPGGARIEVPQGTGQGTIEVMVTGDSGPQTITLVANKHASDHSDYTSTASLEINWRPPWAPSLESCIDASCAALPTTLHGLQKLHVVLPYDAARLVSFTASIDGTPLVDTEPAADLVATDVFPVVDGAHTLTATIERDDGEIATITQPVTVDNCAHDPFLGSRISYELADGSGITASTNAIVGIDLARALSRLPTTNASSWGIPEADPSLNALALDVPRGRFLYNVYGAPLRAVSIMNGNAADLTTGAVDVREIAIAPDGRVYYTKGNHGGAATGSVYTIAAGIETDIITGDALVGDGLLFDADGTLLVSSGPSILRLTLSTGGIEASRQLYATRASAKLGTMARDDQGSVYVVDAQTGDIVRYPGGSVVYNNTRYTVAAPFAMSFLQFPAHCFGLHVGAVSGADAATVNVGAVRGTP